MQKVVGLLLVVSMVLSMPLFGSEPDNKSYVLLHNGSVFQGVVRPVGEKLEIDDGKGTTIQLDSKQVNHVAATKRELYDAQTRSIRVWGTGEHWQLTQWCLQQQLLEQAVFHYRELAQRVEPSTKFKQLEQQLKTALLNSQELKSLIAKNEAQLNVATENAQPKQPEVIQASAAEKIFGTTIQALAIPGYVKKTFHTSISPILINRCGQAGCHGLPGNSSFHIYQAAGDQASTIANQNLEQVLRYINPKDPNGSQLLAYATNAHGIQKSPRFNPLREDDRAHIERITQWIKSIEFSNAVDSATQTVHTQTVNSTAKTSTDVVQAIATSDVDANSFASSKTKSRKDWIREAQAMPEHDRNAKLSKPMDNSQSPPGSAVVSESDIVQLEAAIEKLERQSKTKSKDPFDPNVFNSKFGSKK